MQEAKVCNHGKSPHSRWRNYDDFNEYFWAPFCFELGWPWRLEAGFFVKPKQDSSKKSSKIVSSGFTSRLLFEILRLAHYLFVFMINDLTKLKIVKLAFQKSRNSQDQVPLLQEQNQPSVAPGRRRERKAGKSHFVEHRSGLHLYHSFHRLWIFLVCMLQVHWLNMKYCVVNCTFRCIMVIDWFNLLGHLY